MGDGRVRLSAATPPRVRFLQELRGSLSCCVHGWQWSRHAWQDYFLRAEERWCWRRQEKMSASLNVRRPNCCEGMLAILRIKPKLLQPVCRCVRLFYHVRLLCAALKHNNVVAT